MKKLILCLVIILNIHSAFSQSLEAITNNQAQVNDQSKVDSIKEFNEMKKKLVDFHAMKLKDHTSVLNCLHKAKDMDEMNNCNEPIKKYFKEPKESSGKRPDEGVSNQNENVEG